MSRKPTSILEELGSLPRRYGGNPRWEDAIAPELRSQLDEVKAAWNAKPRVVVWSLKQAYEHIQQRYDLEGVSYGAFKAFMQR